MRQAITPRTLDKIVDLLPDEWLVDPDFNGTAPETLRERYKEFLRRRLANSRVFVDTATSERDKLLKSLTNG